MLIYPEGTDVALRGDLLVRVVMRTDATPVPANIEIEVRRSKETDAAIVEGRTVRVGPSLIEFLLVKVQETRAEGVIQGDRAMTTIKAVGLLVACVPISMPLQRAIIREGASLGEIFRACGAQVRIDSDFTVPSFACFVGMTPSFEIAKALQEEAGLLVYDLGKIKFRRLAELAASKADQVISEDVAHLQESSFLEKHTVPFAISTGADGGFVIGRSEAGRSAVYRPRADQRIVNNMSTALVQRRKLRNMLALDFNAGARVDIGGKPHIVITAAHVMEFGPTAEQYTQFWLGEVAQ